MRFAYGETRFVILTNKYAFKIAIIHPFRPFIRIFRHFFGKKIQSRLLTYDKVMARGCVQFLIPGIIANRTEHKNFKKCGRGDILVPTIFSFFWLINVQLVGEPATQEEVNQHVLHRALKSDTRFDLWPIHQYCVIKGKTLLADYGQDGLLPFLILHAR